MEYHWYEDYWAMPRNLPRGHEFFIGYYQTQRAVHHHVAFIHTDQSCFLSTHLFDQGYRIFLHFKSGTVTEVGRGENPALPVWIIRENMNLEAPLLAGLLGKLTESIPNLNIDDAFLQEAAQGEYCFVEDAPLAPFEKWIERIAIFRWDRTYPADRYFDLQLGSGQWHLVGTSEFAGHSHDLITMEVYER